jgi:hypothetical protein
LLSLSNDACNIFAFGKNTKAYRRAGAEAVYNWAGTIRANENQKTLIIIAETFGERFIEFTII